MGKEEAINCWSRHKEQFNNIKTIVRITKERNKKSKQDKE